MSDSANRRWPFVADIGERLVFGLLVVLALAARLPNLGQPLTEDHAWRQCQVAITTWTFTTDGVRFLDYETPVFGPPWRAPFEFPLVQATAAMIHSAGLENLDACCRSANLLFFTASAVAFYRLATLLWPGRRRPETMVLVYLWCPFTIAWSRAAMIDFASVFFTLTFAAAVVEGVRRPRCDRAAAAWWMLAVAAGVMTALCKLTTVPTVLPLAAVLAAGDLWTRRRGGAAVLAGRLTLWAVVLSAPLAAGAAWVHHRDALLRESPATAPLASDRLAAHNFGDWSQRASPTAWGRIGERLTADFFPAGSIVVPFVGLILGFAVLSGSERLAFVLMTGGAFGTVFVFFNLYVQHNYYLQAATPFLAVVGGLGCTAVAERLPRLSPFPFAGAVCFTGWMLVGGASYLDRMQYGSHDQARVMPIVGDLVRRATAPG
ncbi:MAG: hypothetical protein ACRDD1_13460, partial [Planctomycetia bacterium]